MPPIGGIILFNLSKQYLLLKCAPGESVCNYRNTRRKATENDIIRERGEQNENDNPQWKSREKWRL